MLTVGRYRLIKHLASGGMADVYLGEAQGSDGFVKQVAVKLIRGELGLQSDFVRMFIQEARLVSRLNHANIVHVFDFGQSEGCYYIVMEYVHGRTLRQVMDACRSQGLALGLTRTVHICSQVATALSYAHRYAEAGAPLGIVHRDVSPQNVLISFEGEVKLSDFGIARAGCDKGLTRPGIIKGKVAYMAPEQARGELVDGRADVFALGTMIWDLVSGFQPFERDSDVATLAAVLGPEPQLAPPSTWNDQVDPELDAIVMGALQRDREKRTSSAQQFATQLSTALFKLARKPEDVDLRQLMYQLWPDGENARDVPRTVRLSSPLEPQTPSQPRAGGGTLVKPSTPTPRPAEDAKSRDVVALPAESGRKPRRSHRKRAFLLAVGACVLTVALAVSVIRLIDRVRAPLADKTVVSPKREEERKPVTEPVPEPVTVPVLVPTPEPVPVPVPELAPVPVPETVKKLETVKKPVHAVAKTVSKTGVLYANPKPWGILFVDGKRIGNAPCKVEVAAGRHHVRIERGGSTSIEAVITVAAGVETRWEPRFE